MWWSCEKIGWYIIFHVYQQLLIIEVIRKWLCNLFISNKRRHLKQVTIYLTYNLHWDSDIQRGLMFSLMNWLFAQIVRCGRVYIKVGLDI